MNPSKNDLSTILLYVTEGIGLVVIILTLVYIIQYQDGFGGRENPSKEYNWHIFFMMVGFIFLFGNFRTRGGINTCPDSPDSDFIMFDQEYKDGIIVGSGAGDSTSVNNEPCMIISAAEEGSVAFDNVFHSDMTGVELAAVVKNCQTCKKMEPKATFYQYNREIALLVFRILPSFSKPTLKLVHLVLNGAVIICSVLGLFVIIDVRNIIGKTHFQSLHSWMGIFTMVLLIVQFVTAAYTYMSSSAPKPLKAALMPWHVKIGITIFILGAVTILTVLGYGKSTSERLLKNFIGGSIIIFCFLVVHLLSDRSMKYGSGHILKDAPDQS